MEAAHKVLEQGVPLYRSTDSSINTDEQKLLRRGNFFLTDKPVLAVVNIGEDQLDRAEALMKPVADELDGHGEVLAVCAKLEAEAAQLSDEERAEMSEGLGLGEGALARVARSAYHLLGLGPSSPPGTRSHAPGASEPERPLPSVQGSSIRTCRRGFIRAEVIHWDELIELGSWAAAKAAGRIRVEGSQYVVEDGDVLEIRFNV